MTRLIEDIAHSEERGGYVVRSPRATDSIGKTLATAFGGKEMLPIDMQHALDAIDRRERH